MESVRLARSSAGPRPAKPLLVAQRLSFAYHQGPVLEGLDLALGAGEAVAMVGPNGSGKTTLLKLLCGLLSPQAGSIALEGRELAHYPRRELSRKVAMVLQGLEIPPSFTVAEVVMLGRTPYARHPFANGHADQAVVEEVMRLTGVLTLAKRPLGELSGGERQKAIISMALAQQPEVLLLDEPTAHLDINHQIEILELISQLQAQNGLTVLASMHDLNLAALYFPRLMMLQGGHLVADGTPQEVLSSENLRRVFGASVVVQAHPTRSTPQILLLPTDK